LQVQNHEQKKQQQKEQQQQEQQGSSKHRLYIRTIQAPSFVVHP
jgi:hypothetical protein